MQPVADEPVTFQSLIFALVKGSITTPYSEPLSLLRPFGFFNAVKAFLADILRYSFLWQRPDYTKQIWPARSLITASEIQAHAYPKRQRSCNKCHSERCCVLSREMLRKSASVEVRDDSILLICGFSTISIICRNCHDLKGLSALVLVSLGTTNSITLTKS